METESTLDVIFHHLLQQPDKVPENRQVSKFTSRDNLFIVYNKFQAA